MASKQLVPPRALRRASCRLLGVALLFGCVGAGCASPVRVESAFDRSAAFRSFRSFAMREPNRPIESSNPKVDPFFLQRLRQLTYQALEQKGLRPAGRDEADLIVSVLAARESRVEVYPGPAFGGMGPYPGYPAWSAYPFRSTAFAYDVRQVEEGTIVIDLVSRRQNAVIWRGIGRRQVSGRPSDQELREVIEKILALYPPGARDQ